MNDNKTIGMLIDTAYYSKYNKREMTIYILTLTDRLTNGLKRQIEEYEIDMDEIDNILLDLKQEYPFD